MANTFKNNTHRIDTDGVVWTGAARIIATWIKVGAVAGSYTIKDGGASGDILFEWGVVPVNTTDGMGGMKLDIKSSIYVTKTNAADIVYIEIE